MPSHPNRPSSLNSLKWHPRPKVNRLADRVHGLMAIAVDQHSRESQKIRDDARIYALDHGLDIVLNPCA